jgi:hypothetical protein
MLDPATEAFNPDFAGPIDPDIGDVAARQDRRERGQKAVEIISRFGKPNRCLAPQRPAAQTAPETPPKTARKMRALRIGMRKSACYPRLARARLKQRQVQGVGGGDVGIRKIALTACGIDY